MIAIRYEDLIEGLDGLFAYNTGADSGVYDPALMAKINEFFLTIPQEDKTKLIAEITIQLFLCSSALHAGYTPEDAKNFLEWLDNNGWLL